jgi:hypothetical protein
MAPLTASFIYDDATGKQDVSGEGDCDTPDIGEIRRGRRTSFNDNVQQL